MSEAVTTQVAFSKDVLIDHLKLFEVPEDLANEILHGGVALLRGQPDSDAVFCTHSKTYQIRQVESSNTTLMIHKEFPTQSQLTESTPSTPLPTLTSTASTLLVQGVITRHFELSLLKPTFNTIDIALTTPLALIPASLASLHTSSQSSSVPPFLSAHSSQIYSRSHDNIIASIEDKFMFNTGQNKSSISTSIITGTPTGIRSKRHRMNIETRKEQDDDHDIDDSMEEGNREQRRKGILGGNDEESRTETNKQAVVTGISVPTGRTFADLLNFVQASEYELSRALVVRNVLRLPVGYIPDGSQLVKSTSSLTPNAIHPSLSSSDRYILVDKALIESVTSNILTVILAEGLPISHLDVDLVLRECKRDSIGSMPLVLLCLMGLIDDDARLDHPLSNLEGGIYRHSNKEDGDQVESKSMNDHIATDPPLVIDFSTPQQAADGVLRRIASGVKNSRILAKAATSSSSSSSVTCDNPMIVSLSPKKIAIFKAEQFLHAKSPYIESEFIRDWEGSLPIGVPADVSLLQGLALRKSATVMDPTTGKAMSCPCFTYFPVSALPTKRSDRFAKLFDHMDQWTIDEITPYIKEYAVAGVSIDQLLLKEARAVRSTTLPPQANGQPTMVYTRR